jgi:pyrimidine-nucleoside phosphorylase
MRAIDVIAKKRDGGELSRAEIDFMVKGYTSNEVADYQMSALLMAIYVRGMSTRETIWLTEAMLFSGEVVDFAGLGKPRVDKHSTGGVGDKTSLVLAPVVAAAGVLVPMISGRSLGHSGGTLDKLESIPGFRTNLSLAEFRAALKDIGVALIGQTSEIAPADRKLYALRDVTATVACPALMAASIMSKKMAEGISGLVLDVKVGSGAFLKTEPEATGLARLMIEIAGSLGKRAVALITDMNQPLGRTIGNSLEVIEALEALKGRGPDDFIELCRTLAAEMFVLAEEVEDSLSGRALYDKMIVSGRAMDKMIEIIVAQGGDPGVSEDYTLFPTAGHTRPVQAAESGFLQSVDAEALGRASMVLGAGRERLDSPIDPSVGMRIEARIGDSVSKGATLATLHFNDSARANEAATVAQMAFSVGPEAAVPPRLVKSMLR